jgi:anti-sigma regulatory factor (Ser/Thr protein kinase)
VGDGVVWVLSIPPGTPAAVGVARREARAHLTTVPDEQLDVVLLAISELVTNAILHGEGPVVLEVHAGPKTLCITVTDQGAGEPRVSPHYGHVQVSGRGLQIVELLTSRWGVVPANPGPGKSVWFEVDWRPPPDVLRRRDLL